MDIVEPSGAGTSRGEPGAHLSALPGGWNRLSDNTWQLSPKHCQTNLLSQITCLSRILSGCPSLPSLAVSTVYRAGELKPYAKKFPLFICLCFRLPFTRHHMKAKITPVSCRGNLLQGAQVICTGSSHLLGNTLPPLSPCPGWRLRDGCPS